LGRQQQQQQTTGGVQVFVTDYDDSILDLVRRNIHANRHHFGAASFVEDGSGGDSSPPDAVRPRRLDWLAPPDACPLHYASPANSSGGDGGAADPFGWTREELRLLRGVASSPSPSSSSLSSSASSLSSSFSSSSSSSSSSSPPTPSSSPGVGLVLVADCVYDLALVDGLFAKVRAALASNRDAVCLLSLEKRYNFELETLSVQAHGYRAFCRHIGRDPSRIQEELANDVEDEERRVVPMQTPSETPLLPQLRGRLVPLDSYPQYFQSYERVPQLELWEIRAV
jgi:hypothetical protein